MVELSVECLTNVCHGSLQNMLSLLLEGALEVFQLSELDAPTRQLRRLISSEVRHVTSVTTVTSEVRHALMVLLLLLPP